MLLDLENGPEPTQGDGMNLFVVPRDFPDLCVLLAVRSEMAQHRRPHV